MRFYYPRVYHRTFREQCLRVFETTVKSVILIVISIIPTAAIVALWYYVIFKNHIHYHKEVREIILMAWIPALVILYAIMAGICATWVAGELKEMRLAVKRNDIERFMLYKDEDLSPVVHCVCAILASFILAAVGGMEYPNFWSGAIAVGGLTFVFSFLCVFIREMDDPCHGIWVIKSIPPDWRDADAYAWRQEHRHKFESIEAHAHDPFALAPSDNVTHFLQHKPVGKRAKRRHKK